MFSLSKILVLLVILGLVWFGFQVAGELGKRRQARAEAQRRAPSGSLEPPKPAAEDLRTCPVCETYVPANPSACGRVECPHANVDQRAGD